MNSLNLTLNFRDGTFVITAEILEALNHPKYIQFLINLKKNMLALRACNPADKEPVIVPDKPITTLEVGGMVLLKKIRHHMHWGEEPIRICSEQYSCESNLTFCASR